MRVDVPSCKECNVGQIVAFGNILPVVEDVALAVEYLQLCIVAEDFLLDGMDAGKRIQCEPVSARGNLLPNSKYGTEGPGGNFFVVPGMAQFLAGESPATGNYRQV